MPHKLRKTRKMRGSRTHGYGRVGQHRDAGSKGQRKVGRHKHLWSYVVAHEPDYFGKKGFTSPQSLKRKENPINIKQLTELVAKAPDENNDMRINLTQMGYTKLLGAGKLTKPLIITVSSCSKTAAEKVKKAGGQILVEPQEIGE
jgi:large subunit ribosomal protein L15